MNPDDLNTTPAPEHWVEFGRYDNPQNLEVITSILTDAGVPWKVKDETAVFEMTQIGNSDRAGASYVLVSSGRYEEAAAAVEEAFSAEPLPDDHFLCQATEEELISVAFSPDEWTPFEVGHAKKLLKAQGKDVQTLRRLADEAREEKLRELQKGHPLTLAVTGVFVLLLIMGGIGAVCMGVAIATNTTSTPLGRFHYYDEDSRRTGWIFALGGVAATIAWYFQLGWIAALFR